jgi:hypothetical protein
VRPQPPKAMTERGPSSGLIRSTDADLDAQMDDIGKELSGRLAGADSIAEHQLRAGALGEALKAARRAGIVGPEATTDRDPRGWHPGRYLTPQGRVLSTFDAATWAERRVRDLGPLHFSYFAYHSVGLIPSPDGGA